MAEAQVAAATATRTARQVEAAMGIKLRQKLESFIGQGMPCLLNIVSISQVASLVNQELTAGSLELNFPGTFPTFSWNLKQEV